MASLEKSFEIIIEVEIFKMNCLVMGKIKWKLEVSLSNIHNRWWIKTIPMIIVPNPVYRFVFLMDNIEGNLILSKADNFMKSTKATIHCFPFYVVFSANEFY